MLLWITFRGIIVGKRFFFLTGGLRKLASPLDLILLFYCTLKSYCLSFVQFVRSFDFKRLLGLLSVKINRLMTKNFGVA